MEQYISKSALVAEIEILIERAKAERVLHPKTILAAKNYLLIEDYKKLLSFLDTLEVKEVDLEKEYEEFVVDDPIFGNFITNDTMGMELAKHFFELGLKTQHGNIDFQNLDDLFEEDGIDPNSKDVKLFKECYYTALERYKEKKGIV